MSVDRDSELKVARALGFIQKCADTGAYDSALLERVRRRLGLGKEEKPYDPALVMGAGAGLAVPAYFAHKNVRNVDKRLEDWVRAVRTNEAKFKTGPTLPLSEIESSLQDYILKGRAVAEQPFLGVPTGEIVARAQSLPHDIAALNPLAGSAARAAAREQSRIKREHYYMYKNPKLPLGELTAHHVTDLGGYDIMRRDIAEAAERMGIPVTPKGVAAAEKFMEKTPAAGLGELRDYLARRGFSGEAAAAANLEKVFPPEVKTLARQPGSLAEILARLRSAGYSDAADIMEQRMRRTDVKNLFREVLHGTAGLEGRGYPATNMYEYGSRWLRSGLKGAAGLGMVAGGGLLLAPVIKALAQRRSERMAKTAQEDNSRLESVRDIGMAGAGLGFGAAGAKGLAEAGLPRRESIAVTYGEPGSVGKGHVQPGRALSAKIRKILAEDPRYRDVLVEDIVRNPQGVLSQPSKSKYSILFNTGFGQETGTHEGWIRELAGKSPKGELSALEHTKRMFMPYDLPVDYDKYVGYVTDLPPKTPLGIYRPQTGTLPAMMGKVMPSAEMLAYGPGQEANVLGGVLPGNIHDLGPGLSPILDDTTVAGIRASLESKDKMGDALNELQSHYMEKAKAGDTVAAARAERLQGLRGRKVITVSGSGRGDFVASRAELLQRQLIRNGLAGEYKVVALLAGGHNPALENRLASLGIESAGFLPSGIFNKLQGASILNWGSTGTSSLSENMLHGNIQAIPSKWDGTPQSIAGQERAWHKRMRSLGIFGRKSRPDIKPLDTWNPGNMQYALKQKGVLTADTAEDIVRLLKNPAEMARLKAEASVRSAEQFANYDLGQKRLAVTVKKLLDRLPQTRYIRAGGKAALGLGLLGGLYALHARGKQRE